MAIAIDKDIPLPVQARKASGSKYPFDDMMPGDSFAVPVPEGVTPERASSRLRNAAGSWRMRTQSTYGFRVVTVEEGGVQKVRIWCQMGSAPKPRPPKAPK